VKGAAMSRTPSQRKRAVRGVRRAALALGLAAAVAAAQDALPMKFVGNAINLGGGAARPVSPRGRMQTVEIAIERWSTDEERNQLVEAFTSKGSDGLLRALQKTKRVGYIRTPDRLAWDLHYARQRPTGDGGRQVFLATDRNVRFWEVYENTRSTDYPFTLIQLQLDGESKGEGRMSLATQISVSKDKQHIELENYGSEPVRIENLRLQK
jgi:hypothetical protein